MLLAPKVREAKTNSSSFTLKTWALVILDIPIHSVNDKAMIIVNNDAFITINNNVNITKVGIEFMISWILCITESTLPPK